MEELSSVNPKRNVLVDNWFLEMVAIFLENKFGKTYPYFGTDQEWIKECNHRLESFVQFLDLIVTYDKIDFIDSSDARFWKGTDALSHAEEIFTPLNIEREEVDLFVNDFSGLLEKEPGSSDVVQDGAIEYISIARGVKSTYWPSPQRAEYMTESYFSNQNNSFIYTLKGRAEDSLNQIVEELFKKLPGYSNSFVLPTFGTSILSQCDSPDTIITTALEYRYTKEAVAFRKWAWEVDEAAKKGNLKKFADAIKDLEDVVHDTKLRLSLSQSDSSDCVLNLGISPAFEIPFTKLKKLFTREKLHITFLKKYFSHSINNADINIHLSRLFSGDISSQ